MMVAPLALPYVGRSQADASRSRYAPRAPLELLNGPLKLRLLAESPPLAADAVRIEVAWGPELLAVCGPEGLPSQVLRALSAELDFAALPPDLASFLLEAAILPAIAAWEEGTGRAVSIRHVARARDEPDEHALPLMLEDGPTRWPLLVRPVLPDGKHVTQSMIQAWPVAPHPMEAWPVPAALRLGLTWLPVAAVASLRPGDAVLLQLTSPGGGMLVIGEAWIAAADRANGGWRLLEAPAPGRSLTTGEWTMRDPVMTENQAEAARVTDTDALPIRLAFDVGTLELTLGEIRRMGPGVVLDLGRGPAGLVRITAHGRLLGHGELVDVEGTVGVRITRYFANE